MNNPIAIITGASTGIGKSLSLELSKRNFEIILVSRNKEKLSQDISGVTELTNSEVLEMIDDVTNQITKIKDIRNKLKSVEDCCSWKTGLIKKCDEVINKY